MRPLYKITHSLLVLVALFAFASVARAGCTFPIRPQTPPPNVLGGPGTPFPPESPINSEKAGSVLIFKFVNHGTVFGGVVDDTLIQITNTNCNRGVAVHLFIFDGTTCTALDIPICLTKCGTACFALSEFDPFIRGFAVAVASSPFSGCPISHNFLIGDEFVSVTVGTGATAVHYQAQLPAESVSAVTNFPETKCFPDVGTADICFDDQSFNRLPQLLAAASVLSPVAPVSARHLFIVDRICGNALTGIGSVGTLFGVAFDAFETPFSFSVSVPSCQGFFTITTLLGRILRNPGDCGWVRLFPTSGVGVVGAVLTSSPIRVLNGGIDLHKLTLAPFCCLTVPVFQICDP